MSGDTTTPIMGLVKPQVGGSRSTWGGKWNSNADGIDAYCNSLALQIQTLDQQVAQLQAAVAAAGAPIGSVIAWPTERLYPPGYAICDGGLWPVASYPTAAAVLGNQYGGDGVTTFGVPDYRGCALVHCDEGTGRLGGQVGPDYPGAMGGVAVVTLAESQVPPHYHGGYTDEQGSHQHEFDILAGGATPGGTNAFISTTYQDYTAAAGEHYHNIYTDWQGGG